MNLFVWVSEQAIREVYIKPFQMAIQEGGATGMMGAFARSGIIPISASYNMQELLVRKEWGRPEFMFHTDMYRGQMPSLPADLMIRAGVNHAPITAASTDGNTGANSISGRWDPDYENSLTGGKGGVYIGKDDAVTGQKVYYSNNQWYIVRLRSMQMYSEYANQAHAKNGIILDNYSGAEIKLEQGAAAANASVAFANSGAIKSRYEVTSGTLPAGLELNETTGAITGTPAAAGEHTVAITATFDGWIAKTNEFTFNVAAGIEFDVFAGEVGKAFESWGTPSDAMQDLIDRATSYRYYATGLPEGLTIDEDGIISGTPVAAGEYDVVVTLETTVTTGGRNPTTTITAYTVPVTITITGSETPAPQPETEFQVRVNETTNMLQYTTDAGETWIDIISMDELKGQDGAPGQDGTDGKDGVTPTVEINEDGYWVINGKVTDVKAEGVDGEQGPAGPAGPEGPKGDKGDQGPAGEAGGGCSGAIGGTAMVLAAAFAALGIVFILRRKMNSNK